MNRLEQFLDHVKNYQRPVRMVIWCLCISFAFIYCIVIQSAKPIDAIATNILWGMFADLGVYSALRTVEKNKSVGANTTQSITQTITDAASSIDATIKTE